MHCEAVRDGWRAAKSRIGDDRATEAEMAAEDVRVARVFLRTLGLLAAAESGGHRQVVGSGPTELAG